MTTPFRTNSKVNDDKKDKKNLLNNYFDESNNSKKNNSKKITDNKNDEEDYFDFKENTNRKSFKNFKKFYKNKKLRSSQVKFNGNSNFSKKISTTMRTSTHFLEGEKDNIKTKNNKAKLIRKISRKITQREFSLNSTYSSNDEEKKDDHSFKKFIIKYILNYKALIIIGIINFLSLLSNDIKHMCLPKGADIYFDILNLIFFLYFIVEIVILCFLIDSYLFSFLFILDVIGTICIIFDIEFINNSIFGYNLENHQINISDDYFHFCIIMIERVIRSTKVIRCVNLYNLIESIKNLNKIYSEKMERDLVKEEYHKQKLREKIHNIEDDNDKIEESLISNELNHRAKSNSNLFILNYEEEKQKNKIKKRKDFIDTDDKDDNEENTKIKESKKLMKKSSKQTLKLMRQNASQRKNSNRNRDDKISFNSDNKEKNEKEEEEITKIQNEISEEIYQKIDDIIQDTKISSKVKSSMRVKIIVTFLVVLIMCIFLNNNVFLNSKDRNNLLSHSFIFDAIINHPTNSNSTNEIKDFLLSLKKLEDTSVINITINNELLYENNNLTKYKYRQCELLKISSNDYNNSSQIIKILYSIKSENNVKHLLYLLLTLISCISIIFTYILHETDLTNILLSPFEVMIEVANKVSKDPMNAKNINELEQEVIALLQKNVKNDKNKRKSVEENVNKKYNECYNSYEVKVIMNAIIKISALLAMSVGEAGGQIIHKNLSSTLELHLHSKGKKKTAIFGFCNIRNFEEINLALEEKTIPLINQIADIVHTSVDRYRGNTNKNIGDCFLNVWKFYNTSNIKNNFEKLKRDNLLDIDPINPQISITADCSVLAYLRCILKINKNRNILQYRKNKKLNKVIPNFKINMGFGLHLGYGIEGPVGSVFKMEASYLSPNVNIAARLETATKQFGVSLLISGKLYNICTDELKKVCRFVDCVRVKGSTEPIDLYTIDINYDVPPQKTKKVQIIENSEIRAKSLKEKKMIIESLIDEYGSISPIILEKQSYIDLIDEKSDEFYGAWENAIYFYKNGNWEKAKKYFEDCLEEDNNDGPANTLYNYIKKLNFKSPENWKGERDLVSK